MSYDPVSVATYYVHLFPARNDVYSRWTADGWRPVREPLTPEVAIAGLTRKGPSISGYMIAPGSVSHSFAVDFDGAAGAEQGDLLAAELELAGAPVYIEGSRRGSHLWGVLDEVLPARTIRRGLRSFCASAGLPERDPKIELRPGTDEVSAEGLGHALRLPMMPHPLTGQRGMLVRRGERVGSSLAEVLLNIELIPAGIFIDRAMAYVPPVDPEHVHPGLRPPRPGREKNEWDEASASDILMTEWGVARAQPGRNTACPAHGEDRHPSLTVLKDDRRVICRVPGCILNNDDRGRGTYELHKLAPRSA